MRFLRKEERSVPIEEVVAKRMTALDDPELKYIRDRYGDAVQVALREAWLETEAEDRNLLRHRYVDGYGIDQIAAVHRVHRATAARRVHKAEEALVRAARKNLETRYRVVAKEMQSLLKLIRSQLLVSARTIFKSRNEPHLSRHRPAVPAGNPRGRRESDRRGPHGRVRRLPPSRRRIGADRDAAI